MNLSTVNYNLCDWLGMNSKNNIKAMRAEVTIIGHVTGNHNTQSLLILRPVYSRCALFIKTKTQWCYIWWCKIWWAFILKALLMCILLLKQNPSSTNRTMSGNFPFLLLHAKLIIIVYSCQERKKCYSHKRTSLVEASRDWAACNSVHREEEVCITQNSWEEKFH